MVESHPFRRFVRVRVGEVVAFRVPAPAPEPVVDLMSAVDIAIRDLRDILKYWDKPAARQQAGECLQMLKAAYRAALDEPEGRHPVDG